MGLPVCIFSSMTTFLFHNYIFETDYEGKHKFTMEKANAKNNLKERIELFSNWKEQSQWGEMSSWFVTNKSWLTFDRGNVLSVFITIEVLKVTGLDSVHSLFIPCAPSRTWSNANKTKEESEEGGEVDGSYDGRNFICSLLDKN